MIKYLLFIITFFSFAFANPATEEIKAKEREKAYQVFYKNYPKMYANIKLPDSLVGRVVEYVGRDLKFSIITRNIDSDVLGRDKEIMKAAYEESLDTLKRNSGNVIKASLIYNAIVQDSRNTLKDTFAMQTIIPLIPFSYQATKVLYENAAYPVLLKYKKEILAAIEKRKLFENEFNRNDDTALVALKIFLSNKQERELIRKDTTLSKVLQNQDHLLALLGDEIAENRIINRYNNTISFNEIRKAIKELVFVNSRRTIKALLYNFNEDVFYCDCMVSIRVPIINELYRLYPDEHLLGRLDQYFIGYDNGLADSSWYSWEDFAKEVKEKGLRLEDYTGIWISDYIKSVLAWIKRKYDIIPPKTDTPFVLHKDMCGTLKILNCDKTSIIRKPHNKL